MDDIILDGTVYGRDYFWMGLFVDGTVCGW
jgi:hypothetical protein